MNTAKLERAYRTFVRCHHVVAAATDEAQLLRDVCVIAVDELGFRLAWIGFTRPMDHRVIPTAQAGYENGYLESIEVTWSEDDRGFGPTGRAIRDRRSSIARDIATDERYSPWRADALARGFGSSAAIPLCDGERCLGALNLYAAEPDAFDDDEIALLEEMAIDLVLGIIRLRTIRQVRELEGHIERAARSEIAGTVAAAVAHDLNNLLQIISLSLEGVQNYSTPARREQALGEAARATSSAARLMHQLLSFTRRAIETVGSADADQVVKGLRPLLARLAPDAALELHLGALGAHARMSPIDLERILINLVVNAAHAMEGGGTVSVATDRLRVDPRGILTSTGPLPSGSYVEVSVSDAGKGIAPDVLPRIFEPFFTTKGDLGTGLGLPSVAHLARAAGGGVSVESKPGAGARFSVFVPALEPGP